VADCHGVAVCAGRRWLPTRLREEEKASPRPVGPHGPHRLTRPKGKEENLSE
jgi:hypothetical protein